VGRRTGGNDRSDEHRAITAEIVGLAAGNEVDLVIVAGDTFDTASPSPAAESIVWRALLDLAAVAPVAVVAGNHDNASRLEAVKPLLERNGISVVALPARPEDGGVLDIPKLDLKVAMLPFVSQRGVVKAQQIMENDPDEHAQAYADRMRVLIERLTSNMTPETVNVFTGHLTVYEGRTGGERRAHTILDYAIPASAFPGHLSYVALGHLHRQQKIPHSSSVWYSGSPLQLDFGEVDDQKGVLLVDAKPGVPAKVTTVPLTAGRRLISVSGTLDQVLARSEEFGDAFVKVELDETPRVGLADQVRQAIPNAVDVKLRIRAATRPQDYERRSTMTGTEAFHEYLVQNEAADPDVETLFTELLDGVST
jgi:DNA repair protein SbcD/Mre11